MIESVLKADKRQGFGWLHRIVADLGDQRDVLTGGERGDEIVELEDETDALAPIAR
jgi:hypothetical protein